MYITLSYYKLKNIQLWGGEGCSPVSPETPLDFLLV